MRMSQVVTGSWSKKAAEEAGKYTRVNIAAKGDNASIPPPSAWKLTPGARYVHYCDNETIQVGVAGGVAGPCKTGMVVQNVEGPERQPRMGWMVLGILSAGAV